MRPQYGSIEYIIPSKKTMTNYISLYVNNQSYLMFKSTRVIVGVLKMILSRTDTYEPRV